MGANKRGPATAVVLPAQYAVLRRRLGNVQTEGQEGEDHLPQPPIVSRHLLFLAVLFVVGVALLYVRLFYLF